MSTIPSNWTQLRAAARERLADDLRELARNVRNAGRALERPPAVLAGLFVAPVEVLARIFVTSGADAARDHLYLLDEVLPRLLSHGDEAAEKAPASALDALSYVALAGCLDAPLPASARGLDTRWLPLVARRPDLRRDSTRHTAALAAVAAGREDLVPALDGGGPLQPRTTPREIAGPNIAGFTRHLAEVLAGGGGADAVEGPWWSFLRAFPLTLATDGAHWIDLVWAAIVMMVRFESRPPSDVAHYLPALVSELD